MSTDQLPRTPKDQAPSRVGCVLAAESDPVEAAFDRLAVEHPEGCTCSGTWKPGVRS